MQATLRMVGKEGKGFRQEVEEFSCLSPALAITYDLKVFYRWMGNMGTRALTERTVIGTAMEVTGRGSACIWCLCLARALCP